MIPSGKPSRLSPRLIPLVVFLIGLCSTVVLYQLIVESVDQRQQVYFDFRAREAAERIENRMATYQQVLRGTAGSLMCMMMSDVKISEGIPIARLWTSTCLASKAWASPGPSGLPICKPTSIRSGAKAFPLTRCNQKAHRDLYSSIGLSGAVFGTQPAVPSASTCIRETRAARGHAALGR